MSVGTVSKLRVMPLPVFVKLTRLLVPKTMADLILWLPVGMKRLESIQFRMWI